jgi:hypothetical protein
VIMEQLTEYRAGRNFIRLGDIVKVTTPEKGSKLTGRVTRIDGDTDGNVTAVHYLVVGGRDSQIGKSRATTADRIERVAQSTKKAEELKRVRYGAAPTTTRRGGR